MLSFFVGVVDLRGTGGDKGVNFNSLKVAFTFFNLNGLYNVYRTIQENSLLLPLKFLWSFAVNKI
jgi:hypothetical protein